MLILLPIVILILVSLINTVVQLCLYAKHRDPRRLKNIGLTWLIPVAPISLIAFLCLVGWFNSKTEVKRDRIIGDYVIDTKFYPGENAKWQKKHYRFTVFPNSTLIFYERLDDGTEKKYRGDITWANEGVEKFSVKMRDTQALVDPHPVLYRDRFGFHYVFRTKVYGDMFYTKVGRLFRMGKVELRTAELLDARAAFELLKNTRQHGSVKVRLQEQFDATKVNALKTFHHDFFDRGNGGTDARSVGQFSGEAFAAEARDLAVLLDQVSRYAFLEPLRPIAARLTALAEKDYTYLINQLAEYQDDLLTAKDDVLSPLKAFMHGPQRAAYFLRSAWIARIQPATSKSAPSNWQTILPEPF